MERFDCTDSRIVGLLCMSGEQDVWSFRSHEREESGSLISLLYKMTGRQQGKQSPWLVWLSTRHFYLDYPMDSYCYRPHIHFPLKLLCSLSIFLSMVISSVWFPICSIISSFCFLALAFELSSLFFCTGHDPSFIFSSCSEEASPASGSHLRWLSLCIFSWYISSFWLEVILLSTATVSPRTWCPAWLLLILVGSHRSGQRMQFFLSRNHIRILNFDLQKS